MYVNVKVRVWQLLLTAVVDGCLLGLTLASCLAGLLSCLILFGTIEICASVWMKFCYLALVSRSVPVHHTKTIFKAVYDVLHPLLQKQEETRV